MESARFWAGLRPSWERAAQNLGPGIDQLLAQAASAICKKMSTTRSAACKSQEGPGERPGRRGDRRLHQSAQSIRRHRRACRPTASPRTAAHCRPTPKAAGKRKKAEDRGEQADEVAREDSPRRLSEALKELATGQAARWGARRRRLRSWSEPYRRRRLRWLPTAGGLPP